MIVLPMAGLSSRFFDAGYTLPKYMLGLHGHTVFAHAMGSFAGYFQAEQFLITCRDIFDTPQFVKNQCQILGVPDANVTIVVLDVETKGQAETVAMGLDRAKVSLDTPLTVFNIDTFRPNFKHPDTFDRRAIDGYLEVFIGEGTHWSFVRPDLSNPSACRAQEVCEKVRISDFCSDGLYYFRSVELFLSLYHKIAGRDPATLQGGERYVAPLYDIAIRQGCDIRYSLINDDAVLFCGTPKEFKELQTRSPFSPFGTPK